METARTGEWWSRSDHWLAACVWCHAAVVMAHSATHVWAAVWGSALANLYIWIVIIIGPLAGLWLGRRSPTLGAVIVAVSMCGALVFGVLHHFVWSGIDHVQAIPIGPWRTPFRWTAASLVLIEAAGVVIAVRSAQWRWRSS